MVVISDGGGVLASASMEPNPSLQIMELISGGIAASLLSVSKLGMFMNG